MLCDDLEGWDVGNGMEIQERGDACTHTHTADSLRCTAGTNTTL